MKFSIAINMERTDPAMPMTEVADHALHVLTTAENAGFEIAWAAEHHCVELTIAPNPFVILTHWAAHTSRIRLGTAVVAAPYWHPLRVAAEAALTDLYSNGRLELGLGRGAFQFEFDRMAGGLSQQEGGKYLQEMVPVVRELWAGDYAYDGTLWKFPLSTSVPKPVQDPFPPMWVAARSPETFDFSLKSNVNIMSTPLSNPFSEVENLAGKLAVALSDNPDCKRPRWLVSRRTCVYESTADWGAVADAASAHGKRFEGLFSTSGSVVNGFPQTLDVDHGATGIHSRDEVGKGIVHGTPDQVVAELKRYRALGVDSYCYNGHFGLPHDMPRRSLDLFANEVMPHFQD